MGDPILGPLAFGKDFCRHIIGFTQEELHYVTIIGLPDAETVHVGLMNYDNNPGFGVGHFDPGQRDGILRIVASWSNGHKEPPSELAPLIDHLKTSLSDASRTVNCGFGCSQTTRPRALSGPNRTRTIWGTSS